MERLEAKHTVCLQQFASEFQSSQVEAVQERVDLQKQLSEAEACLCGTLPADQIEIAEASYGTAEARMAMGETRCMRAEDDLCRLQLELEEEMTQADSAQSSLVDLVAACSEMEAQCRELHVKSESCDKRRTLVQTLKVEREELMAEGWTYQVSFTNAQKQFSELFGSPRAAPFPQRRNKTSSNGDVCSAGVSNGDASSTSVSSTPSMQSRIEISRPGLPTHMRCDSSPLLPRMVSRTSQKRGDSHPLLPRTVSRTPEQRWKNMSTPLVAYRHTAASPLRSDSLVVGSLDVNVPLLTSQVVHSHPLARPTSLTPPAGHSPISSRSMVQVPWVVNGNGLPGIRRKSFASTSPNSTQWSMTVNRPVPRFRVIT